MKTHNFKSHWVGLSPEEKKLLAEKAETSVAYLSQVANKHRNAGWKTIRKLVQVDERITYDFFEQSAA